MAKLTLFFNNRPIDVFHLEESESTIGRDASNTFVIDSLAIAPSHLKISLVADEYFIESVSEHFSTLLNDKAIDRDVIHQGDKITIGKYTLFYSHTSDFSTLRDEEKDESPSSAKTNGTPASDIGAGNLQVMNGKDIGLVISLNKALSEINIGDTTPAIIAKRPDGYFISALTDDIDINIYGSAISSETKLINNTALSIGTNKYLFFIE